MDWKYEKACKEAGCSAEQIRQIRKVFDEDRKKLKRENAYLEKQKMEIFSLSKDTGEDGEEMEGLEVADPSVDLERDLTVSFDRAVLSKVLSELTEEERNYLLTYYGEAEQNAAKLARLFGLNKATGYSRLKTLFARVKTRFFELDPGEETDLFR